MSGPDHVPPGLSHHILPGVLREIAEVAGLHAAVALCLAARGGRFYIPDRLWLTKDHPLVRAVGWRAAQRIAQVWGHEDLAIPTARPVLRAYRARVLRTAGYTANQIAAILDMDRSHVQRLAPAAEYPPAPVEKRVLRAILDDAPRRFSRMKPGDPPTAPPPVPPPGPSPLFAWANVKLPG